MENWFKCALDSMPIKDVREYLNNRETEERFNVADFNLTKNKTTGNIFLTYKDKCGNIWYILEISKHGIRRNMLSSNCEVPFRLDKENRIRKECE